MERKSTSLRIVERRMVRLLEYGYFWRKFENGILYYVSFSIPQYRKKKYQTAHRFMESKFWAVLDAVLRDRIIERRTDRMLRVTLAGAVVPDAFFKIGMRGYFVECDTGKVGLERVIEKSRYYFRDREYIEQVFDIDSFRILWITKLQRRVHNIPTTTLLQTCFLTQRFMDVLKTAFPGRL